MSLHAIILGFLNHQPMYGYDLNKAFQASAQNFWTTEQSQIYRALHRLHKDGLVDVEIVTQRDHPDKKNYHITDQGRDVLNDWLTKPLLLTEAPVREAWLAQLFFADGIATEKIVNLLETYLEDARRSLASLEMIKEQMIHCESGPSDRGNQLQMLTLDYGVESYRFTVEWLEKALNQVQKLPDPDDSGRK